MLQIVAAGVLFLNCAIYTWRLRARRRASTTTANAPPPCRPAVVDTALAAIPSELWQVVAEQSALVDALALCCACRSIRAALGRSCAARLQLKQNHVMSHFPEHVQRSVPMKVWLQTAWIDFDPNWLGTTGYIDRVKHSDVPGCPFKFSRDCYGRLFLILRRKSDVAVLFQRYSDNHTVWAFASNTLPIGGCRLSDSMVARLALWLAHDYADFQRD